jgi:hypothetical protein
MAVPQEVLHDGNPFPSHISHVSSAAFAQARLRFARPIHAMRDSQDPSHQKSSPFNEAAKNAPPTPAKNPKHLTIHNYTDN